MTSGHDEMLRDRDTCPMCGVLWSDSVDVDVAMAKLTAAESRIRDLEGTLPLSGDNVRLTLGMTVYVWEFDEWLPGIVERMSLVAVTVKMLTGSDILHARVEDVYVNNPNRKD